MRKLVVCLWVWLLLLTSLTRVVAQDDQWTCDNGPHDVLSAAQAAYDAGDLAEAHRLALIAEELCSTMNIAHYTQALNLRNRIEQEQQPTTTPGEDLDTAFMLYQEGAAFYQIGQYEQALATFKESLELNQQLGNRQAEGVLLGLIGEVYRAQGQYTLALDTYTQSLDIAREVGDRDSEGIALNNIGLVYGAQGQYALALDYFTQALDIAREVGDRVGEATVLNNISMVYGVQGQYALALDYFTQALVIVREVGNLVGEGTTLNNIGGMYDDQGQHALALDYYTQALDIVREIGDRFGEGITLSNIGAVYYGKEQYTLALDAYTQALVIMREVGNRAGEGNTLYNIGGMYDDQGQYALALDYYTQALAIHREVGNRAGEILTLGSRGLALEKLCRTDESIADYAAAVDLIEQLTSDAALDEAITGLLAQQENTLPYQRLVLLLTAQGNLVSALEYTERGRGILTRDEMRGGVIDFRANLDDQSLLDEEEHLRLVVVDAQNLVNALNQDLSASNADIQNAENALDDSRAAYDRHLERMQLQGGFLARELALDIASLSEIQGVLPDDTTLLLYGISEYDGYALLVTENNLRGFILNAASEEVETLIRTFVADRRANAAVLQDLYNLVFALIAEEITTANLIISPDGVLNYVPFAALQAPDGSYLIDHYTIGMIPSGTALVLLSEQEPSAPASSPGLVLAQPSAPGLPRLRYAQSEAETVAEQLGVNPIIVATETDLRSGSTGATLIHISAHAELDRFAPLYSVIHLGEDDQHDGRFEVREIYELDLTQGTELVVLSGCETASGGTGEDFGLLSRAFFAVGVDRVIASLWNVDDVATADLLAAFYTARADYDTDTAALRAAMLTTREQYPEPYYWASFVLSGLPE